jgi:hypothetical protein
MSRGAAVRVVFANRRIGDGAEWKCLHGTQCGTAAFVEGGIHGGQDAALCAEADVPSLLVEVEVLCIELVEEVRVADVQLMGGDTDDWA